MAQWFPHRYGNSEYSGRFSGSLIEIIRRLREALAWRHWDAHAAADAHTSHACTEPVQSAHARTSGYIRAVKSCTAPAGLHFLLPWEHQAHKLAICRDAKRSSVQVQIGRRSNQPRAIEVPALHDLHGAVVAVQCRVGEPMLRHHAHLAHRLFSSSFSIIAFTPE